MKSLKVIALFIISLLNAELTHYERGVLLYEQRASKAEGLNANTEIIDQAINEFLKGYKTSGSELSSGIYLLRCYYYKGKFVAEDDQKKKDFFNQGKALGEKLIELYPEAAGAYYWYLVNLGSWAEVYGILSAAKEGVANTMREYSTKIINIDPSYSDGGGYFMLGAVHFKSPYIPFILSWPSDDKALNYLSLAYETGVATPNQTVYLARALYANDKREEAISMLSALLDQKVSESNKLEDIEQHDIASELLKDWK